VLLAERGRRFTNPLPRVAQIFRKVPGQRLLGRRPAVVRDACRDPLLAVVALVARLAMNN
jgi:hypothetical protein